MIYSTPTYQNRWKQRYKLPIPFTKEEEHICILCLATKYEKEAREALILHNLRLVWFIADHLYGKSGGDRQITWEELISDGQYGLVKAANTFSKDRETSFATYAYRCIQNQMFFDIRAVKHLSNGLPLYDERAKWMLDTIFGEPSLEDPVFEYVYQKIRNERICDAYEKLNETEKRLLIYRYFIIENRPILSEPGKVLSRYKRNEVLGYSQKDVSKLLGLSQSYVSRLEKNVLHKIKKQANCGTIEVEKYRTKE